MADAPAKQGNPIDALKRKVGPLPLGVWLAAGLGIWWYLRKKQATGPGGSAANGTSQTGYGTDAAGNTGYIDPSTGYVYGSAEDVAALQSQGLVGANSYNTGGSGDTSGTGVGVGGGGASGGTDGSGTPVTTPGAPGTGTGGTPTPGSKGGAKNWRYPAPGGLSASNVSDSGYMISWQPVQGPNGQKPSTYTVATYQQNGVKVDQFVSGSTTTREYGAGGKGLHPGWTYRTDVWANGGPLAPPHASVTVTVKPKGTK